ncbi:MAG: leucyl aminopeptidase [Epsilonproteobacteria bacterium]|nr:leucyl aminopeptidase [Campylobacterota bacterium]
MRGFEFKVFDKKVDEIGADIEIVLIVDKNMNHRWVKDKNILKICGFKAKEDEVLFLPEDRVVYSSCASFYPDDVRVAVSNAFKALKKAKIKSVKIGLYTENCPPINARALVEGILLGTYSFDKYKSDKDDFDLEVVNISTEDYNGKIYDKDSTTKAVNEAVIIANATNKAKDIVNTPPADMTPEKLANYAEDLAKELDGVECFVGDEKFLEKEKMGAFLAVAKASVNKPRLIHLTYKPKNSTKRFVFVGKGLTYDSGGLSLKPSEHMVTMKADKSGAAAAINIIRAASELKLPYEVHAVIGAAENMIGGNAYKPDDVLVSRSGKTIEVRNTDAEGRLVLCDCLDYAQDLEPDYMFDLATLTGACVVALGEYTIGVMGHNTKLKRLISKVSKKSGELAASLPFNKYLKKLLKSDIADISNISSSRYGGAITAGLFLDNFIRDEYKDKWLHLDIAGPAYIEKSWGYNQPGASGAGVRLCVYWLKELVYLENSVHKEVK